MLRLLRFILAAVMLAAAITLMFSLGEGVHVEAFGWKADAPAGFAAGVIALTLFAVAFLVSLYKDLTGLRRRAMLRGVIKRREKGVDTLVAAALAQQGADFDKAKRLAEKASRLLDRDDVIGLFRRPDEAAAPVAIDPALALDRVGPEPAIAAIDPPVEEPQPPAALPSPDSRAEEALDRDIDAARRVS